MPNAGSLSRLKTFWHKVQRWANKCFLSIPISILAIESCQPPRSPPGVSTTETGRTPHSLLPTGGQPCDRTRTLIFPLLSSHRTLDNSKAHTRGLSSVYLTRGWKMPLPVPTSSEPPPCGRSGSQDHPLHRRPFQGANDQLTPGPRSVGLPPPAIPDNEHVLRPKEQGPGGTHRSLVPAVAPSCLL